jgi:tetratricopeptide (TPR) repeat protein
MMKYMVCLVLIFVVPGMARATPLEEGILLMTQKRYPEAVSKLEFAAHAEPGSPDVMLNLGWAYWRAGRTADAWRVGSTLVQLDPGNKSFLVFLAGTDIETKRYADAEKLAKRALKIAPEDHDASMVLARAYFLQGREKDGVAVLDRVLERSPGDAGAAYRKAMFISGMGRRREALTTLDALLAADPTNASYRRSRAKVLSELGRQDEAVHEWKALTRQEPDAQSLMNLGWSYWHEKNYEAAWDIAALLVKLDDKNPTFLRFMANLEIQRLNYAEALRLAQRALSLTPGDRDAELTVSKALFRLQREKEAMAILEKLIAQYPDNTAVQFRWAEFLSRTGREEESLGFFDRLIKADPGNEAYRFNRATARYQIGDFDAALAEWRLLAGLKRPNPDAVRALRDDAFNRRAWDEAVEWQRKLIADNPSDPAGWEKLSKIQTAMKQPDRALAAAEQAIAADPVSINAYYLKSEILEKMHDWPAAKRAYEEVVRSNPNSIRAYDGLSYVLQAQGDYAGSQKDLERVVALTAPTVSPYLEIHRARLWADAGRFAKAHRLLERLAADRRTVIPVLLYHGISRFDRGDSIPQSAFRRQMQALKAQGYESMVVSQLDAVFQGRAALPAKPILITFDDGRTDSFENADPVLKEIGYRATMFVHVSKLRKTHFHASPVDIARWQANGRWEMQAHGSQAHDPLTIDGFGRKGHFLPNRMWLASPGRLETLAEYKVRVESDYEKARQGVEDMIPNQKVVAFAYPYGDYGQNDYSNTPESAAINQKFVKKHFRLAFVQEQYGLNTISSNPTDLRRFEVPRYMTPEQLTAHLVWNDPRVQAQLIDAQLWVRADQLGRAEELYADLKSRGIDGPALWAEEGLVYQKGGDIAYARNLFARAAVLEPDQEGAPGERDRTLLAQSAWNAAPSAALEVQRFTDSDTNAMTKMIARGAALAGPIRLELWAARGEYSDRRDPAANLPRIDSAEGGISARWFPRPSVRLSGQYARRDFYSGGAGHADIYGLEAAAQVLPALKLALRDAMGNVETAAAIRAQRRFHLDGLTASWDPALDWKSSFDYDRSLFNDGNLQQDVRARASRRFSERVALGAAYYHGDSRRSQPEYYTPHALNQYTGVLTLNQRFGELNARTGLSRAEALFQYEGGYGIQPAGSRAVHSLKAGATIRPFDRAALNVDGQYSQSPTYISRRIDGTLSVTF